MQDGLNGLKNGSGHNMELRAIKDDDIANMIRTARSRAFYAAPGVTDTVAGALIDIRRRLDRNRVRVVPAMAAASITMRTLRAQTDIFRNLESIKFCITNPPVLDTYLGAARIENLSTHISNLEG